MRSGRLLVSLQLALSLPLLVGAGLLAQTVYNLQRADLGFSAEHLLLVRVDVREAGNDASRGDSARRALLEQFQQIPGVHAASYSQLGVFSGGDSTTTIEVEGFVPERASDRESGRDMVGPGYFSTLGIPILAGREILTTDRDGMPKVCVINEAFAKRFFDKRNAIGLRLTSIDDRDERTTYQIVGVTGNARTRGLRGEVAPRYFVAADQPPATANSPTFLIRAAGATAPVLAAARAATQRVDAALPVLSTESIEERMAPLTAQDRTTARLAVVFGCVALTLAAIGLYGVLSYGIARRRGEIAIRIALGALPGRVIAMILRETIGLLGAGLAVGGGLAYAASRLIDSRLYGVPPQDPLTLVLATALLLSVALGATYLPARRASRLDPTTALRQQ
jgi:predicted permease